MSEDFSYKINYKPFDMKDLNGKSGYFVYGIDRSEGDYGCELLVFIDSDDNHYLIDERFKGKDSNEQSR